mgnify:FL=1
MGQPDSALADLKNALKLNPNNAIVYNNIGYIFYENGDFNNADKYYNIALSKDSLLLITYINRGLLRQVQNLNKDAIADYEIALRLKPGNTDVLNNLGLLYKAVGNNNKALLAFKEITELDPSNALAWFNIARIRAINGEKQMAISALSQSFRFDHALKKQVKHYNEFEVLKDDKDFQKLIK